MKQSALHVAIIMDGNGRWAASRGLPRIAGHYAGVQALRAVVEAAPFCGIEVLTTYAFSADNWKRPAEEVASLMSLLSEHLDSETPRLLAKGVRLSVIGRRDRLPETLLHSIAAAESATISGPRLHLRLAIDYSARESILSATERATNHREAGPLTLERFEVLLGHTKPLDLLIRTGGEQRLSDFLLWESAYAELLFTKCMWPDFNEVELRSALVEFRRRDRRFGGIPVPSHDTAPKITSSAERWLR